MSRLIVESNIADPDAFYAALTDLHRHADRARSERINARLILLLANHVGDNAVLEQALQIAGDIDTGDDTAANGATGV